MRALMQRLFDTSKYDNLVEKDRIRLIYGVIAIMLVAYTIFALFLRSATPVFSGPSAVITDIAFYAIGLGTIWAGRSGRINLAGTGPLLMVYAGGLLFSAQQGFTDAVSGITLTIFVLLAGLLYRTRGLMLGIAAAVLTVIVGISMRANLPTTTLPENNSYDLFIINIALLVIGIFTYLFLRSQQLSHLEGASQAAGERLKLAQLTSQTAQRISSRMPLEDVLSTAVEQIRDNYPDIYHAQIFLLDEGGQEARLVASTGEIGKFLMQRGHKLNVGSLSVIGQVTLAGEAVIARADDPNSIHRRNEALPDTASETAFPLRIGSKVIGALDLQSRLATTFHPDDVTLFQSLADHIAVAIDNARLFEETEERLRENQQLVEQARSAIREVERLNRQLTGRAWAEYLRGKGDQLSRSVDLVNETAQQETTLTPTMMEAIQFNYVAQSDSDDAQAIAIPIRVRGQVIGAIEFELDKDTSLSPEDLALIQEVGERFGLAAENVRLFERSQRIAQREALVNEIGVRLQATNDIETTLTEAARSLKQSLRADRVAIRLGTPAGNGAPNEDHS